MMPRVGYGSGFMQDLERTQLIRQRIISQSTVHASLLAGAANAMTLDGEYLCETAGDYTFGLLSTGRAKMRVDDEVLIDNWTAPSRESLFHAGFNRGSRLAVL